MERCRWGGFPLTKDKGAIQRETTGHVQCSQLNDQIPPFYLVGHRVRQDLVRHIAKKGTVLNPAEYVRHSWHNYLIYGVHPSSMHGRLGRSSPTEKPHARMTGLLANSNGRSGDSGSPRVSPAVCKQWGSGEGWSRE